MKKHKRNEKANYDEHKTEILAEQYRDNADCNRNRFTRKLEQLFDLLAVRSSYDYFFMADDEQLTLSGDETALPAHFNPYGHKVKHPVDDQHSHRYTDPSADWGWALYKEMCYFSHSLFVFSYHRKGLDLPMFLTILPASQQ